jgi:cytochrome c oxidase subunit 3
MRRFHRTFEPAEAGGRQAGMAQPVAAAGRGARPSMLGIGVIVWLASELMFFAGLFAAWFTTRSANGDAWPPEGVELDVARTAVATVVLVASSFTIHAAVVRAEHGDRRGAVRWTLLTVLLGALFLGNQAAEYTLLVDDGFTFGSNAYSSLFYLLTGFHGLHVLGGLVLMLALTAVGTGRTKAPLDESLTVASYYWHFVDVVWVAMFTVVYLLD